MNRLSSSTAPPLVCLVLLLAAVGLPVSPASPASAATSSWDWPVAGEVVQAYAAPSSPYGPGHRGLDVTAAPGTVVRTVAPGRVTFAGDVAGVSVVTVDHGTRRSTYQPVSPTVSAGDVVGEGTALGRLDLAGSHCPPRACLHLGRIEESGYADPLELLAPTGQVRLFSPDGPPPVPPAPATAMPTGVLTRPVDGPVTSPFGMRVHPITGVRKLHDGLDIGAACGTEVRASDAGTVRSTGYVSGYGNQVVIDHGPGLVTTYNHLTAAAVGPGEPVAQGQTVGTVGSTGLSTGCHLHLMVLIDGAAVDPGPLLEAP